MTKLNAKTIGMTEETIADITLFLTKERQQAIARSLRKWLEVGDVCTRIKAAKIEGKFKDNVNEILGAELTNDERQYSMKLHDLEKDVIAWYEETGCLKYNPRTIYTAYQAFVNPKVEKTEEEKEEEKAETELRKERTGADTIEAIVAYKRIRDNASENGNLVLGDLETILQELKNEITLIEGMIEFEKPVTKAKGKGKGAKKAA